MRSSRQLFWVNFFWVPLQVHSNGTTSTPQKLVVALAPNQSTLQWHPTMAPRPLPQSWTSFSTPPTIAHYNGTLQWHPQWHVVTLPRNHSTLQWHPTMAPSNGTTSPPPKLVVTLPMASSNGSLVPRPIRQSGSSPSPPIGSKNPYSYHYLGNNQMLASKTVSFDVF